MFTSMPIDISITKSSSAMRNERARETQLLHFTSTNSDGPMPDTYRGNDHNNET